MRFREFSLTSKYRDFEGLHPKEIVEDGKDREEEQKSEEPKSVDLQYDEVMEGIAEDAKLSLEQLRERTRTNIRKWRREMADSGISSKWDRDDFEAVKYRLNRAFNVASCAIRKLDPHHNRGPISRSDIMKIIDKNMRADDDRAKLTKSVLSKLEGLGYELI